MRNLVSEGSDQARMKSKSPRFLSADKSKKRECLELLNVRQETEKQIYETSFIVIVLTTSSSAFVSGAEARRVSR